MTRGVFVLGPQRYAINNVLSPSAPTLTPILASRGHWWRSYDYLGILDANRPRTLHAACITKAYDNLILLNTSSVGVIHVYKLWVVSMARY